MLATDGALARPISEAKSGTDACGEKVSVV